VFLGTLFWIDGERAPQRGTFFGVEVGKKNFWVHFSGWMERGLLSGGRFLVWR